MKKIHCPSGKGRYCRQRVASPKKFARNSLRTITRGSVKIVVGCPKGKFKKGKCSVGTRAQTILRPLGSPKCQVCRI